LLLPLRIVTIKSGNHVADVKKQASASPWVIEEEEEED